MPLFGRVSATVERIHKETDRAVRTWAVFEALNGPSPPRRARLRSIMQETPAHQSLKFIELSAVHSVVLSLCRLVDDARGKNSDRLTLDVVALAVRDGSILDRCVANARSWNDPELQLEDVNEAQVRTLFRNLRATTADDSPETVSIRKVRASLKDLRNALLAHSIDQPWRTPQLRELRRYLIFCASLSRDASWAFRGRSYDYKNLFRISMRSANTFWDHFEAGLSQWTDRSR
jgi:HEPN superfamily AbiU2-like protein